MKTLKKTLLFLFLGSITVSCYYDNKEDLYSNFPQSTACDTTVVISFKDDIQPLFDANCGNCHGINSPSAGLSLVDYGTISSAINDVVNRVKRPSSDPLMMPPTGKLPNCDIQLIEKWVADGMINN